MDEKVMLVANTQLNYDGVTYAKGMQFKAAKLHADEFIKNKQAEKAAPKGKSSSSAVVEPMSIVPDVGVSPLK